MGRKTPISFINSIWFFQVLKMIAGRALQHKLFITFVPFLAIAAIIMLVIVKSNNPLLFDEVIELLQREWSVGG